jgi:hypothetical protein
MLNWIFELLQIIIPCNKSFLASITRYHKLLNTQVQTYIELPIRMSYDDVPFLAISVKYFLKVGHNFLEVVSARVPGSAAHAVPNEIRDHNLITKPCKVFDLGVPYIRRPAHTVDKEQHGGRSGGFEPVFVQHAVVKSERSVGTVGVA